MGDDWIRIPKLGPIKARVHRSQAGTLKSITLSRSATGKYFASLLVETEQPAPVPLMSLDAVKVVGLDMGLSALVTDSSGGKVANLRFVQRAAANLRRKQKALSRCQCGSARRAKARQRVARAYERLANARRDFQHQLSRKIIDDNQAVIVETLIIRGMMKSRHLAQHIGDAAWHGLIDKITYKVVADASAWSNSPPGTPARKPACSSTGSAPVGLPSVPTGQ